MTSRFEPGEIYGAGRRGPVRALVAPRHYVQGADVLDRIADFLGLVGIGRPGLLLTEGGRERLGDSLSTALGSAEATTVTFGGECSPAEVGRVAGELRSNGPVDGLVALGGGKCLDAGKSVAARLGVPIVTCPTVASTDAPCSSVSVLYTEEGDFEGVEHFRDSPALVLVDTAVIAAAPVRYLVAGMGDALSTRYEARTCRRNPDARTPLGARMTVAGVTLADAAARVVLEDGTAAAEDVRAGRLTAAVERVVEANTLLSGMGFEGGGIAAAHALATGGLPLLDPEGRNQHGEQVAFGVLTQLALEAEPDEAARVAAFMATVGLPVHLGQLGVDRADEPALRRAAGVAADAAVMGNEPFEVTPQRVLDAMREADAIGRQAAAARGDAAYRSLRADGG